MNPITTSPQSVYFIGLDLHSTNVFVCIKTAQFGINGMQSQTLVSKKFNVETRPAIEKLLSFLQPYCENTQHYAVVESTYNWYWLADEFEARGWNLRLADPCTVSQANLKYSDDKTDAEYLAECLYRGSLKTATILSRDMRDIRDLCRFRMTLVQERAMKKITIINLYTNQLSSKAYLSDLLKYAYYLLENDKPLTELLDTERDSRLVDGAQLRVRMLVEQIIRLDKDIQELEAIIFPKLKQNMYGKLMLSIKGCGPILASLISFEIGDISRFHTAKDFKSYCRLAPTAKLSNGKSKGLGNAKNGNAYLSWAMTELANLIVRFNPAASQYYERKLKKTRLRVKAIRTLAAKIAGAIFMMLKHGEVFDVNRCFSS